MPKSSVTGVVIVVMLDGGKGNERLGDGHSDGFMGDNQARFRHASSPDAGIGCVVPGQAARHEITLLSCHRTYGRHAFMSDSALPPRYAKRRAPVVRDEAFRTAKRRRVAEDSDDGMDVDPEDASGVQDARSQDTAGSPLKLKTYRKEVLQSALTQNSELLLPHECATAADST